MAIWLFWLGYFTCYVPYTFLIKATGLASWQILAGSTLGCVVALITVWTGMGWWNHIRFRLPPTWQITTVPHSDPNRAVPLRFQRLVPGPINPAVWSGVATIGIILSTTVGYALSGASAVFMAILMKVGTLGIAPIIDKMTRRRIRPAAKAALAIAIMAALIALMGKSLAVTMAALAINVVYLAAYAVKLRLIADRKGDLTFMVTDQTVAVFGAAALIMLVSLVSAPVASGFTVLGRWEVWAIGVLSQCTGVFGCLMFLAPQEHSFCVTLNRGGSILATICATFLAGKVPASMEMVGASMVLGAIGLLAARGDPMACLRQDQVEGLAGMPAALPASR